MIRVLVVDDSALVRKLLTTILSVDPAIEVVGTANNPVIAQQQIELLEPDVLTLDVEMPEMDGITFLRQLMRESPLPVVMISHLTTAGAATTLEALALGAVDFVSKPGPEYRYDLEAYGDEVARKVKAAARANIERPRPGSDPGPPPRALRFDRPRGARNRIIAIGASTGGTEAILEVLARLPDNCPGIVISQHIPGAFSAAFAERLDQKTTLAVCEAADGQPILPGHAYLAPGGRHLRVVRNGSGYRCRLDDGPEVNRHKPSVEVLFKSVADNVGAGAIGILLTGMGDDGAEAMGLIRAAGAYTLAQDEATSVVWGMPGEAVRRGHADAILPLGEIAEKIVALVSQPQQKH